MNTPLRIHCIAALALLTLLPVSIHAQAWQGYTLFSGENSRNTYLVNMSNQTVHSWTHTKTGGYSCYLLEDGSLLRPATSSNSTLNGGGAAGIVQKVNWNGGVVWEFTYSSNTYRTHHDLEPMPNGNILAIAWEVKTSAQCVAAGLNHSASLWPDMIIEIQPVGTNGGNIVWEWHAWDHLIQDYNATKANYGVVGQHPELIDINCKSTSGDWLHINAVSYNPTLDQIAISSHNLDEVYIIDHSTTTAQAASHSGGNSGRGGDIIYRWGSPANYDAPGTQVFDVVHCAYWIPAGLPGAGNLMAFNNRERMSTSMVVELTLPTSGSAYAWTQGTAYGPASPTWSYTATGFFSNHLGGNQRLPNGNTLIAESTSGYLFEVNSAGVTQWSYQRGGSIARVLRYDASYPGLQYLTPVEMSTFSAVRRDGGIALAWRTETETNNHGFEIERLIMDEGGQWETAGFVSGQGTTLSPTDYAWFDDAPAVITENTIVYRLCQIDTDGSRTYSARIEVSAPVSTFTLNQNHPNPFNPTTTISYTLPEATSVRIDIVDMLGRRVATPVDGEQTAGSHAVMVDATQWSAGTYRCVMHTPAGTQSRSMSLVK